MQPRLLAHSFSLRIFEQNQLEKQNRYHLLSIIQSLLALMQNHRQMEQEPAIRRPSNGLFHDFQLLKKYHQQFVKRRSEIKAIPIVFQHWTDHNKNEGFFLFYVKPTEKMGNLLQFCRRKAIEKDEARQHESIYIFLKDNKKKILLSIEEGTVQGKYQAFKDEDGFLFLYYRLASQQIGVGFGLNNYQVAGLLLIAPVAIPVIGAVVLIDWGTKKIVNSLPSFKFSLLGSNQHKFKFKQQFSLSERQAKCSELKGIYKDQIVTIVEKHKKSKLQFMPFLTFLTTPETSYQKFCMMLKAKLSQITEDSASSSKQSIFFVVGDKMPSPLATMHAIWSNHKDADGMLYVTYQEQESF